MLFFNSQWIYKKAKLHGEHIFLHETNSFLVEGEFQNSLTL